MTGGYQRENTSVHLMNYPFVWCSKYRRQLLTGKIKKRLKELIKEKAKKLDIGILSLDMSDYVYLFVSGKPILSANKIVGKIKGHSSRILRKEFPEQLKMPTLWTRSYFVSTAGKVSKFVIQKYIEEQYK